MLKVPELKPGQEPFDPDFEYHMHPGIKSTDHFLPAARDGEAETSLEDSGAILMGMRNQLGENARRKRRKANRHYPEERELGATLDHIVVKDAITTLHREGDEQMRLLSSYEGIRICDIVPDQQRFLNEQADKYKALFSDDRQKHLFKIMTRDYFEQALHAARLLRNRKIRHYQTEAIERQNREFVERALRPESVFDDQLQTAYRDMILFNLENLYADLPPTDRNARLDEASNAFYRKIIDKRLELDPARLRPILDSAAIRRVLGKRDIAYYEDRIRQALRDDELEVLARDWVKSDLNPLAAKLEADGVVTNPDERAIVMEHYRYWRYNDNQKRYLTIILNAENAWREIEQGYHRRESLPLWVRRGNPYLRRFLLAMLSDRERGGGLFSEPDYPAFLDFPAGFDPFETSESIRNEEELYSLAEKLGGLKGEPFQIVVRILLGKKSDADTLFIRDLEYARRFFTSARLVEDDESRAEYEQLFLICFVRERKVKMERESLTRLYESELLELAEKCLPNSAMDARQESTFNEDI